jgi:hypothetical protein
MAKTLRWYTVLLAFPGVIKERSADALHDLEDELHQRPHLRNSEVLWDLDFDRLTVRLDVEDVSAQLAGERMVEEMFEVGAAVFPSMVGIHVDLLASDLAPSK